MEMIFSILMISVFLFIALYPMHMIVFNKTTVCSSDAIIDSFVHNGKAYTYKLHISDNRWIRLPYFDYMLLARFTVCNGMVNEDSIKITEDDFFFHKSITDVDPDEWIDNLKRYIDDLEKLPN